MPTKTQTIEQIVSIFKDEGFEQSKLDLLSSLFTTYLALPQNVRIWHNNSVSRDGGDPIAVTYSTAVVYGFYAQNSGATWDQTFQCDGGTYTLNMTHITWSDHGKVQLQIDGANIGNPIDMYSSAQVLNVVASITGIVLTPGQHNLTGVLATKNASSSGNLQQIHCFDLIRTGA